MSARTKHPAHRSDSALFAAFLVILFWAPIPFASNRIWGAGLLFSLLAIISCLWLLLYLCKRASLYSTIWENSKVPAALLLTVQVWILVQIIPLPPALVEWLSPEAFRLHLGNGWITLSLDPIHTHYYLLKSLAIALGFFLSIALINSHSRVEWVLRILVISGIAQALYGISMVVTGYEFGFLVEKYVNRGIATGTFVNRNHFAAYMVLCLAAGIGLFVAELKPPASSHSWRARLRRLLSLLISPRSMLRAGLVIMVAGLIFSQSRMGNVAFLVSLFAGATAFMLIERHFSRTLGAFLGSILLIDVLLFGRWFGLSEIINRLSQTALNQEPRFWSTQYAVDMLRDFWLTGSGGGSFYGVFPNYQGPELSRLHVHAHNDYLEITIELGIVAMLCLAGFVIAAALQARLLINAEKQYPLFRGVAFSVIMACAWVTAHSMTDFNLQIPANALTLVVMLSLAFTCRGLEPGQQSPTAHHIA